MSFHIFFFHEFLCQNLEVEYGCEDFSELRACSIFAESSSVIWFILFGKFSWAFSDSKFGLFNIAVWLKDSRVLFSCDVVANGSIAIYLFWRGVKIWLLEISPDWFGHKVQTYNVEFAMMLSNMDFSLSVTSPTVSSNNWLTCDVSLYLSPAMIMLLLGLIKIFNLSKNGLWVFCFDNWFTLSTDFGFAKSSNIDI